MLVSYDSFSYLENKILIILHINFSFLNLFHNYTGKKLHLINKFSNFVGGWREIPSMKF